MTALTVEARAHLSALVTEWQLLADLSFSDLILWIRNPEEPGYLSQAHIRPSTAATVFAKDMVGRELAIGEDEFVDQAFAAGVILRDAPPEISGDLLIKEEAIPVRFAGDVIAVISRHRDAVMMRSASRLEINYREIANLIYGMVASGDFPIRNSIYESESVPRAGDGLIRLDASGIISFASPNAHSALSRAGWEGSVENHLLARIVAILAENGEELDEDGALPTLLNGASFGRGDLDNSKAILDFLIIPLLKHGTRIGAIALVHDVTELRRRDRALLSKDATIREIHHRVKNNLQTVSALLRLQSRRVEDPTAAAALEEAVRRVASIAIVHETLSTSSAEEVAFDDVYDRIIPNAVSLSSRPITYTKEGSFGTLEAQVATPLALVITELIHNSLEHGLAQTGDSLLTKVENLGTALRVSVIDNGVGLPAGFSFENSSNLGLQIVRTLTENELKGSIKLERINGETRAVLTVPLPATNR